jgi:hypothetical protein
MNPKNRNPVSWFEIYTSDISRARRFYEGVFGVQLQRMDVDDPTIEMWVFPGDSNGAGVNGTICKMDGMEPGRNGVLVYFACDDCAVEEKRVSEHGGRVQKSKESIGPFGFISLVQDSEGNLIGLHSMK